MMSDQQELLQRETMGIQSDAFGQAFKTKALRALLKRAKEPTTSELPTRHIIISIDPSGGGSSHFALVSCYYECGMMVVCGLESIPAKSPADYENGIRNHCRQLRLLPKFKSALFVVCPEANLGFERYVQSPPSSHLTMNSRQHTVSLQLTHRENRQNHQVHRRHVRGEARRAWHVHHSSKQRVHVQPSE